jgi:hypothetical protein
MPPEQIDRAVGALLALALDLAVADQAIEPRAGLASIKGADQPRDRGAGYRCLTCDHVLEVFDGSFEVLIRLTIPPKKSVPLAERPISKRSHFQTRPLRKSN